MIKKNKRGAVSDVIIAGAALLTIVLVISVVGLILYKYNEGIQASSVVGTEAKEASSLAQGRFTTIIGYGFLFAFLGFVIYTIVTSIMISSISPVFWVVGFVLSLISSILFTVLKQIYGTLRTVELLGPFVQQIPYASMYFNNIELISIIWIFAQFTLMYRFRDKGGAFQ